MRKKLKEGRKGGGRKGMRWGRGKKEILGKGLRKERKGIERRKNNDRVVNYVIIKR